MKYIKRKYATPTRPWDKQRLESERVILREYGLKNKKELWRMEAELRKYRRLARVLETRKNERQERLILDKLVRLGILEEGRGLDDILALTADKFLERRLQTVLQRKGTASTVGQARQIIVHGHVKVGERKVTYPSYIVSRDEESKISVTAKKTKVRKIAEEKTGEAAGSGKGGAEEGAEAAAA